MAADDAAVVVSLRADLKQYESALKTAVRQTERAAQAAEKAVSGVGKNARPDFRGMNDNFRRATRQMENDARASQSRIQRIFASLGTGPKIGGAAVGGFLGGIAAGFSLQEAQQLIDASSRIANALKSTGLAGTDLTKVYDQLFAVAQKNAVPIENLAQLYGRLGLSQKELGVSQQELVHFTGTIAAALRAGGQSAEQASGALLQLSQALGGGVVRAEEFNSILEGAPTIIQAAAAGIAEAGGSVSKLRQLMIDGKVSSEAFFKAIEAGAPVIEQRLAGAEMTISQAFVRLQNVLIDTAGKFNASTGASKALAEFLSGPLTQAIKDIGVVFSQLSGPVSGFVNFINNAVDTVVQAAADLGAATGLDQVGGSPYIGPGRRRQLQGQMRDAPSGPLPSTGVVSGMPPPSIKGSTAAPAAVVKPISLKDYPIEVEKAKQDAKAAGAKVGEAYQEGLRQSFLGGRSSVDFKNTDFAQRLNQFIQDANRQGQKINIFSGQRDLQHQSDLYWNKVNSLMAQGQSKAQAQQSARKWVAFPSPDAPHIKGIAADLKFGSAAAEKWAHDMAASYGLVFRMSHEGWHIELADQSAVRDSSKQTGEALVGQQQSLETATTKQQKAAEDTRDSMQNLLLTVGQMAAQGLVGFVQDLRSGVDAAEALYNAVSRIADQLLSMALNMMIQSLFKGIAGGVMGGGMFPAGAGLWASGGYTGDQARNRPAGIVHGQEFVVNAAATQKHRDLLEAINRGAPGYASGGFVLPNLRSMAQQMQPSMQSAPSLDARTTVVNTFDSGSFLSEALSRPDGVKVILNAVRAQPGAFKQALGS